MANKKTKRALLSSVMALVLCFTMLLGTTFAWFTDSVTSENNIIKSGNLDIELEYWDGDSWETVEGASDVLSGNKWEPGYVDTAYLRLTNAGSLALKYQLGVNIVSETAGVNAAGDEFKLSDYIYFDVVEGVNGETGAYATRVDAMAVATSGKLISDGYSKAETLLPEGVAYFALVAHMPTTVGNEANHNGTNVPEINLGINVVATQVNYESDSFGNDYDGGTAWLGGVDMTWYDAEEDEFTISSAEQLAGLAALVNGTAASTYSMRSTPVVDSFKGKTITLTSDIDFAGMAWAPIGNWDNVFEGTFDGNGHTIKNLYINAPEGSGVGFFGVAQSATIKNVTFENVDVTGYEMVAAVVGSPYTGCTISNCHVTGDINLVAEWAYVGGICAYGYTKIDNCSVVADGTGVIKSETRNAVGGISAWLLEDASSITNCEVKNLELTGWANIGAITGFMHRLGVIDSCSAENVTLTKTREDGHPTIGLAAGGWSYNASKAITITNNTFKNITLNGKYLAISSADVLYGAEYAGSTNTNFVLDNNTQENITNNLIEVKVINSVDTFKAALSEGGVYALANKVGGTEDWTLALTEKVTVPTGKDVVIYLNGKTIAGTSTATGSNFDLIDVRGTLTLMNGTITTVHTGANMAWNNSTNVFNVTAGGVLNIENMHVENLGGSDMAFGVHLNNWGEVTLNVTNSTVKSTYCAVRVFNSGHDNNNVTIKDSTIYTKGNRAFWVHNYSGDNSLLNFDIFGNGNTYVAETDKLGGPIRYGFDNPIYFNANGTLVANAAEKLDEALNSGEDVVLGGDLMIDTTKTTANSGYGATGVKVDGSTLDGNGHSLGVNSWGTWDCAVNTVGGTIKNLTINSGMRGIFMGSATADVYIDNVVIDGTIYTFNSDGGSKEYGVYISNSTLNGWTSYSDCHKEVVFTNCNFGEGQGYAFLRAYNSTKFVNCHFSAEDLFEIQVISGATATFENCYYGDTLITADNIAELGLLYATDASLVVVK